MFRKINFMWLLAIVLWLGTNLIFAQGTTGRISGTVTDQNGAVVQGASVKVTNLDTSLTRETTSDEDGVYAFQLLPAGRYKVEISAANFSTAATEVIVNITQTTTVDTALSVAGATVDPITVTAEAPVLQAESSQTGRVIEGTTIRQLPLPTRNFQQLLTLQSGAQSSVSNNTELGRGDATISVNGQRTTSNSVRINGIDANSVGTNSTPNIAVPATDSLQEFVVQTSLYDASNGRNSGGNVEAITRGGSNDFNGNVYYFFRNKALNANEPFIKARGFDRPVLSRNQYGATFGGRIVRDKAFFFVSYQGTKERNGLSLLNSLAFPSIPLGLTNTNRTAAGLSAAFGVPAANINSVALAILNARLPDGSFAIPSSGATSAAATCPLTALGGNVNRCPISTPQSGVSRFKENQFNGNLDFNFSDNHSFSSKLFFADNPTTQANYNFAGLGNGNSQLIGFGGDLKIKQKLYSFTDTYVFSPNVSNQARFGFSRLRVTSVPQEPFTASSLGIANPLANLFPGAPTITVAGLDSNFVFGSSTLADQSSRINAYTLQDTVSIVFGKHRIRTGGEFRYSTVKFYFNAFSRGQLIFGSFNNFLLGAGTSILGSGVFDRSFKVKDYNTFVQDDYKVSDRLTLNLGVRYDLYGLPAEAQGRLVNFLPDQFRVGVAPNGLVQAEGGQIPGVPTVVKTLVPTDKNNFSPRVGFAFRADNDGRIVIRGGYGIYYDRISTRYANTQLFNFPYLALGVSLPGSALTPAQTFANPFIPLPQPSTFPTLGTIPSPLSPLASPFIGVAVSGVFVDPNLETPYVQQYNLGVQWEFFKNTVLEVGYVGNKGTHLLQTININQPVYNSTTNSFSARLAAPTIISANKNVTGGVHQIQTSSNSNYNSFQATLTKRFAQGAQIIGAYTFGKSYDYYSGAAINELTQIPGDQYNWKTNYGRSDFNREQRLVVSGVYDIPKFKLDSKFARSILNNWEVAGIAVFQSGLPFSIVDNPGNAVISRANFNPAFTGQIRCSGSTSECLTGYFNQGAFSLSRPILAGNTGIGVVNNPTFDPAHPFGNTPRNFLTGPGQKNVDISFIKFIPINERFRAEFRAEFFNVFNWVNYANPVNNIALGTFGQITSASTGPRVVQLGFKLNF
ncbi:MAG TPA: TonB-dependent receptor [Pyrinomonadaceae bacterium]|jgi:outer membrane receptor protein involved in Fe transport